MLEDKLGALLIELSDVANCVGADMHQMHLNMCGFEFDTMHKEVLKTYYEEAADDYDEFAEKGRMYGVFAPTPTASATRIGWQPVATGPVIRDDAIDRAEMILEVYVEQIRNAYILFNGLDKDASAIGVANFLQTRLEYWTKELNYFNKNRRAPLGDNV